MKIITNTDPSVSGKRELELDVPRGIILGLALGVLGWGAIAAVLILALQ